jgi:hypothetical protein
MGKKKSGPRRSLFRDPAGQSDMFDKSVEEELDAKERRIECLGMTFDSEEERRRYFLERLREKLQDPEFRKTPGFPKGSDEAILRMSDPPWYTACPNPFLDDFLRCYGKPYDPEEPYHREPFAVDVSEGKYDWLYRAHPYHTKVPHLAIVPSILHYTRPGDVVLDGFCGSGMTGLAAQFCGVAPREYRKRLGAEWAAANREAPEWGPRRTILNDLGPAATAIAAGYNLPFKYSDFRNALKRILARAETQIGWMYETRHGDARSFARLSFTVWSEIFTCPECSGEIVFLEEALDPATKKTRDDFRCPHCDFLLEKHQLQRVYETVADPIASGPWRRLALRPVLVNYSTGTESVERSLSEDDLARLRRIEELPYPHRVPGLAFPFDDMWEAPRLQERGISRTHHLFLKRSAHVLATLWEAAEQEELPVRRALLFAIDQALTTGSLMNRYRPGSSFGNGPLRGVYYVGSQIAEASIFGLMEGVLGRMDRGFSNGIVAQPSAAAIGTGDCAHLGVPRQSVDYIFTDPPFGDNFAYWELNYLVESWYGVLGAGSDEAGVDRAKTNRHTQKSLADYQAAMRACFEEYYRLLKPHRWITVVFSNSKNSVWRALQEALGAAGFVVADVRTLDKKQLTFKQVTSSAVKQDLVISAYKPLTEPASNGEIVTVPEESAWSFVREHLAHVPIFISQRGEAEVIAERTHQVLLDRMIAFHVQRGLSVPIGASDFFSGLAEKFPRREGMFFLPGQVAEYDRKRMSVRELRQLTLFPTDEATAIQWMRQQLERKPQRQQDLTPIFHKEIHGWAKHEKTIDIRELLEQSFLRYDGRGPIPNQIVSYLKQSSAYRPKIQSIEDHLGGIPDSGLETNDQALVGAASGLWYVPDPSRQGDLEKARERQLLREFEEYRNSKQRKIKEFRTEAVRAGFKAAYDEQDYETILDVGQRLPEKVLQEDEKLLMYYDVASMRAGGE